ncbi:MAG: hypothetical protein CVU43_09725 [Chloroflexi bacterium HGW-Chloroflexi-5]|jgi:hypothetical protein|nr:MAG: hypothetical protein CVU43_09725 [Chloroflexi bacterium HGW-Chloroflexi-5]
MKFSSFDINMFDISHFNGKIDWSKFLTPKPDILGIRMGYGVVTDDRAVENWQNAKGKVNRVAYWYMDYYSNHIKGWGADGVSDKDWGIREAEACWKLLKNDPEGIVFLDIENGNPAYAPDLSAVTGRAQTIAKAILQRMDELNGKKNGIYCSLGLLSWFSAWFKDRPLWVAWYNEYQTAESVQKAVKAAGWVGPCVIWQYASHGCLNGDGVPQGRILGTELKELDLNGWIGTAAQYSALFGKPVVVTPEDEVPVEEPEDETPIDVTDFINYRVTASKGLAIRELPTTKSTLLGYWLFNAPVTLGKSIDQGVGSVQGWSELEGQKGYMSLDWLRKE